MDLGETVGKILIFCNVPQQVVPQKDTFRYLGSMLQKDGDIDLAVSIKSKLDG